MSRFYNGSPYFIDFLYSRCHYLVGVGWCSVTGPGDLLSVMPRLAVAVAHPVIAGLILTAPFGAVMATVSAFLVVVSSGLVRDVYQRWFNPRASDHTIRIASYLAMVLVAVLVAVMAIRPPEFLQALIVYTGGSMAAAFLFPAVMMAFWPRATVAGTLASMIGGPLAMFVLYLANLLGPERAFKAYAFGGLDPFVWGLLVSAVLGIVVSRRTPPPEESLVRSFFSPAETEG